MYSWEILPEISLKKEFPGLLYIHTNFLAVAFVIPLRMLVYLRYIFSSYRQVFCLASPSIQTEESNLQPRLLKPNFGVSRTEKNAEKDFKQMSIYLLKE